MCNNLVGGEWKVIHCFCQYHPKRVLPSVPRILTSVIFYYFLSGFRFVCSLILGQTYG